MLKIKNNLFNKALALLYKPDSKQAELFSEEQLAPSLKEKKESKKRRFIFVVSCLGIFGLGYFLGSFDENVHNPT